MCVIFGLMSYDFCLLLFSLKAWREGGGVVFSPLGDQTLLDSEGGESNIHFP